MGRQNSLGKWLFWHSIFFPQIITLFGYLYILKTPRTALEDKDITYHWGGWTAAMF